MLRFDYDTELCKLTAGPGQTAVRSTPVLYFDPVNAVEVRLYLSQDGQNVDGGDIDVRFQARDSTALQRYDGDPVLSLDPSDFTYVASTGGSEAYYTASLTVDSAGLRTLLGYDPNALATSDQSDASLLCAFKVEGYGECQALPFTVRNSIVRVGDVAAPSADGRLLGPFTALTGSTSLSLDTVATASRTVDVTLALCVVSNIPSTWQLIAGTTAENTANGIVRPDDYNGSTNAKIWSQIS